MPHHHLNAHILHHIAGAALGLFSASTANYFGTRAAERLPGESMTPLCLFCLRPLEWFESFPLFGWLLRQPMTALPCPCGERKGLWAQPLAEILGMLLGIAAVALAGWSWAILPLCLGLGLLPAIAMIDLAFGIIPDELNITLGLLGLSWIGVSEGDLYLNLVSAAGLLALGLLLALVYSKWRGREMLGLGDVKFFAAAGLWLSPMLAPWFLASAGLCGVILGIIWHRLGGSKEFPFAPALCLALAGCLFYALSFPL